MAASADSRSGLVVALDGPASSGKSSVGSAAAAELGYRFCDTGLLYRAVTWLALQRTIAIGDSASLLPLVDEIELKDDGGGRLSHVSVDGVDRTADVHSSAVDVAVSGYSAMSELRLALLTRQRRLASAGRIVMAGRDIGTIVLPDADLKIYLDASTEERARRRSEERGFADDSTEATAILHELQRRDQLDSSREIAPLRAAPDAVVIKTDGNAFDDTVREVIATIRTAEQHATGAASASEPPAAPASAPTPIATPPPSAKPARAARTPVRPTPVATSLGVLIRIGSGVLRVIARAIVRLHIEGDLSALPKMGPLIMAANHASSADPVLIGAFLNQILRRPLNWLGKRELVEFPLTGWAFRRAGIHGVDRDAADLEAFRTATRILEAGHVLAVFPEGTRSRTGGLQEVREGVGLLALRSGAPVLPVAVIDSDLMWPRGHLLPRFGKHVTVRYGKPFVVADELAARGLPIKGRQATGAATTLVMTRIAELLPPRQRGVYASAVTDATPAAGAASSI